MGVHDSTERPKIRMRPACWMPQELSKIEACHVAYKYNVAYIFIGTFFCDYVKITLKIYKRSKHNLFLYLTHPKFFNFKYIKNVFLHSHKNIKFG